MAVDYEKLEARCAIDVRGAGYAAGEEAMLAAVLARAARWVHAAESITIQCNPRVPADAPAHRSPGWLEYGMRVNYPTGGGITIGAIQRGIGADVEFHS